MRMPSVAIVGRPNVGKSTLFNRLAGRRISIVEPTAGVTRDRVITTIDLDGRPVELVDTGGIGIVDVDDLAPHIEQQISLAIERADVIVFATDAIDGLTPLDRQVAERLRKLGRPVVVAVNKVDDVKHEPLAHEFYALGLGEPVQVSALHGFGQTDLRDRVRAHLPPATADADEGAPPEGLRLAVVGRRNVGKSTFVNALAGAERVIAAERPGTTRDAIDVRIERDGEVLTVIDTAGMRRKRSVENAIELFSQARTDASIERADVVLLMFDVSEPLSQVDQHLAKAIEEGVKPCVLVGNKWDLARDHDREVRTREYHHYLKQELPGLEHCPIVFTTATEVKGVWSAVAVAKELYEQAGRRVSTGELNRLFEDAVKAVRPRVIKGVVPKIYFGSQQGALPPKFVIQVNKPSLFDDAYRRYLRNQIRERFGMAEVPIELIVRERKSQYVNEERGEKRRAKKARAKAAVRRAKRGGDTPPKR